MKSCCCQDFSYNANFYVGKIYKLAGDRQPLIQGFLFINGGLSVEN